MRSSTSSGLKRISPMSDGWIECPECEGDGFIEITRGGVDANGPWMSIIPRRCPECDGDGEVPLDD